MSGEQRRDKPALKQVCLFLSEDYEKDALAILADGFEPLYGAKILYLFSPIYLLSLLQYETYSNLLIVRPFAPSPLQRLLHYYGLG